MWVYEVFQGDSNFSSAIKWQGIFVYSYPKKIKDLLEKFFQQKLANENTSLTLDLPKDPASSFTYQI